MVEREARCLALEQAYVHEVYHQMGGGDHKQHPPWPRIAQFLNHLEQGSIVCDVGCGSGKYLSVNPSVYKVGADRCSRLTETAREEEKEVLVCDNLSLPFRDESFDAVLSIAVIHHFATRERRIGAIKELARVLRIGGRLVISVWAMEQRHRKFESQDVLVPWHRPTTLSTPSLELTPTTTTSEEDSHHHLYAACMHTSDSDSGPSRGSCTRRRSKCKMHEVAPSPSSSSLSSPNESCYSFVRRALKKLAGVKRGGARSRPWFLESWTSCTSKEPPPRRYDPEGCEDIQDQPIELRRLEEDNEFTSSIKRQLLEESRNSENPLNQKSKSLTDIVTDQKAMVRSQSSVPSLEIHDNLPNEADTPSKPRLVKQKKSVCEEDVESEERDKAMDMKNMVESLPEFKVAGSKMHKRGNVFKQSSMNEELMSTERLREKEKVRQNIQKQASLNEELIYNRNNKTLDSLKDSLFSTSTAKRFQIIKTGLTNKIKNSTTGIEKVAGASIKNGFVRILQNWTSGDIGIPIPQAAPPPPPPPPPQPQNVEFKAFVIEGKKEQPGERRHSREDGSDSSKDSSLQSDTSVDSEDSFASVIFVPKSEVDQHSTNTSPTLQSTPASPQPTSPKIKFPPPISPKMKPSSQITFGLSSHPSSPKLKHPGQLMSSTTPTSPKMKYFPQSSSPRPFQANFLTSPTARTTFTVQQCSRSSFSSPMGKTQLVATKSLPTYYIPMLTPSSPTSDTPRPPEPVCEPPVSTTTTIPTVITHSTEQKEVTCLVKDSPEPASEMTKFMDVKPTVSPGLSPTSNNSKSLVATKVGPIIEGETPPKELEGELTTIKHSGSILRSQFPLVRRSATMYDGTAEPPRPAPRLLSLEIFNPETDDMDSDSSGLSSPDSVGSVISIKNEEETVVPDAKLISQPRDTKNNEEPERPTGATGELKQLQVDFPANSSKDQPSLNLEWDASKVETNHSRLSPLLEAAADVATSLEETVDVVIQSSPKVKRKQYPLKSNPRIVLEDDLYMNLKTKGSSESDNANKSNNFDTFSVISDGSGNRQSCDSNSGTDKDKRWDEECRQHLADFAEKLSEKLLAEIDRYREQSSSIQALSPVYSGDNQLMDELNDPYLCKLSEDLEDLTKLSKELQEKNEDRNQKCSEPPFRPLLDGLKQGGRVKGEGAAAEEKHVENENKMDENTTELYIGIKRRSSLITDQYKTIHLPEDEIPLLQEYTEEVPKLPQFIIPNLIETLSDDTPLLILEPKDEKNSKDDAVNNSKKNDGSIELMDSECKENPELSDPDSSESEGNWTDSRRNTILPNNKVLLSKPTVIQLQLDPMSAPPREETTIIELLPAKDMPRRPSISVEMSEPAEQFSKDRSDFTESNPLHLGISLESSEAGDLSERTGSSSEGSRPSSRRETIQISDSGSIQSLRPGLSIESSEAGDYSDKAGSDGSRDSRRDTVSFGDITSSSQNSLLRPGNSIESSDAGDVSDRTGSDVSRQNTSSAGKTPSTASFASDKASDCSKDARFADRRMARCDGRSSSEEMPLPRSCMNKLVRQRASTQEPNEHLNKAQSCETSLSGSTSQDSLLSDSGGGAITFHRYYHVFREGELDQLIERYVESLHIISSYYDHANWCVVAEKVQVWTI
ncbi:hypothetical protein GE061_001563 [Apolygus lucorum]|uniref:Methyltransferase type 11 domain-containing protein n=1 Tax=Apolygus lucorum TaxID=248454 RepID=A0A6A4KJY5_APOLU|nr:hypothetical protein GE061_001563 [Apolygus lucorum]